MIGNASLESLASSPPIGQQKETRKHINDDEYLRHLNIFEIDALETISNHFARFPEGRRRDSLISTSSASYLHHGRNALDEVFNPPSQASVSAVEHLRHLARAAGQGVGPGVSTTPPHNRQTNPEPAKVSERHRIFPSGRVMSLANAGTVRQALFQMHSSSSTAF